ncbi:kinase-like domain-containing protein [Mycena galopus ATCC 62051]|nr:kinase-like domain-containing protein [Mycena galopus ATCC 62051]
MMMLDPAKRPTAEQLLSDPYFEDLRISEVNGTFTAPSPPASVPSACTSSSASDSNSISTSASQNSSGSMCSGSHGTSNSTPLTSVSYDEPKEADQSSLASSTMSKEQSFVFPDYNGCEPSSAYTLGGLCPIRLGCVLGSPPHYRILAKLGHGTFFTMWLARDRVANRNVALKIVEAKRTTNNTEPIMLQRLITADADRSCVNQVLDVFEQTSPNGVHEVLVMDPLYSLDLLRKPKFGLRITREVVRQLVESLASIHNLGIAHGDLHPDNFGMAVPEVNNLSELEIWEEIGRPYTRALVHSSMDQDPASFPPYLSANMDLGRLPFRYRSVFARRPLSICLLDVGNAYFVNESSAPRCSAPLAYAPPEVVFPRIASNDLDAPWDQRSDIWSLALCIYALICSRELFSSSTANDLLSDMIMYCDDIPATWHDYVRHNHLPGGEGPQHVQRVWKAIESDLSNHGIEDPPGLVQLLRRMMKVDPAKRPTVGEVLQDPYFKGQDPGFSRTKRGKRR